MARVKKEEINESSELRTPKGTRDLLPPEKIIKNDIVNHLVETFELFGFNPIETPCLERLQTLTAKFGAGTEADVTKEMFTLKDRADRELGLRFDMTVPLARIIATNPQLSRPFKRYAIGPAWRNGPIKLGRYREFWQCDVDTIGVKSMIADAELIALSENFFEKTSISYTIKVNNRKLLKGLMDDLKISEDKWESILVTVDKRDKLEKKELEKELKGKGLSSEKISKLLEIISDKPLSEYKKSVKSVIGQEGIKELEEFFAYCKSYGVKNAHFDVSLVRGLGYYTGTIFEAYAKEGPITSSIAGGGRWNEMIQKFGDLKEEVPAVGIAFGLDVITDILKLSGKVKSKKSVADLFIIPIKTQKESIEMTSKLRSAGIRCDMDLLERGISKNLEYVNSAGIKYVLLLGERELKEKKLTLKNMESGEEHKLSIEEIIKKLKA